MPLIMPLDLQDYMLSAPIVHTPLCNYAVITLSQTVSDTQCDSDVIMTSGFLLKLSKYHYTFIRREDRRQAQKKTDI